MPEVEEATDAFPLWADDPSSTDLLSFDAVADTVVDALLDDTLDPLAIGVSGQWGSGKTTVLRLIDKRLQTETREDSQVIVVSTDPWRYDPATGAKESLIGEVLDRLKTELGAQTGDTNKLLGKLIKRVDWAKAARLAAKTALTLQIPNVDSLADLIKVPDEGDEPVRGLEGFREEFGKLMAAKELSHVRRVVVLVDDLDRCLPETVVDTLEAIRLFLAVPKMSFVLAADEERVSDAIRTRFPKYVPTPGTDAEQAPVEEPAKLYLHKIVQTTVPIPGLSRFDTEAYLVLLQLLARANLSDATPYVERCADLRRAGSSLDELADAGESDIAQELLFAARLTPILYEKLRGNPRRIKRFLNDLHVRQSIAARRGIPLAPEIVAKLMVLELLIPHGFEEVLGWLARNELRDRMSALEIAAGRGTPESEAEGKEQEASLNDGESKPTSPPEETEKSGSEFEDDLLRWAKMPPALGDIDLAPYLHLAAAFTGEPLLDTDLPERLRDIAASLLSSQRADQKSVTDEDLAALSDAEAPALVRHLGRAARDRPTSQIPAILGLLRISRLKPKTVGEAATLLSALPVSELQVASVLHFKSEDVASFEAVLKGWQKGAPEDSPIQKALNGVIGGA